MGVTVRLDMGPLLKLKAEAKPKAAKQVGRFANIIKGQARMLVAVDTSALKNSIMAKQIGELTWEVRVGQDYGWWQEFGTSRMAAHPFLIPAVEGQRAAFVAAMRELFE